MMHIAKRIIRQIFHDKRSLAMMIIMPLILISLLYLVLGKSDYVPKVALDGLPDTYVEALKDDTSLEIVDFQTDKSAEQFVREGLASAVISFGADGIEVVMFESDSVKTKAITGALKDASASINPEAQTNFVFLYGDPEASIFDSLGFLLLAFISFFIVFLFSGISFVRERSTDTVERLMHTPVRVASVVGGYIIGFSFFALIQSTLLVLYAIFVLNLTFAGPWWVALIIMLFLAVLAVVIGIFVSALSRNEFQVMQFIPVIVIPQCFLPVLFLLKRFRII
jgi:ABC-2 type transport system permease protein